MLLNHLSVLVAVAIESSEIFVSVLHGDDSNPGTTTFPVRTLTKARDMIRNRALSSAGTVSIEPGFYALDEALALTSPADSGVTWQRWAKSPTDELPAFRQSDPTTDVVISGGVRIGPDGSESWKYNAADKAWEIPLPVDSRVHPDETSLFLNDEKLYPTRTDKLPSPTMLSGLGQSSWGIVYPEGLIPDSWDTSAKAVKRWRIVINYSWTVGHHTVRAVFRNNRTIVFDQLLRFAPIESKMRPKKNSRRCNPSLCQENDPLPAPASLATRASKSR
jgi:hypothetical protein